MPRGLESVPDDVRDILRIALYQLLFLENIPDRAAVDQAVRLARWAGYGGLSRLVNAVLRSVIREGLEVEFPDSESHPARYLATFHSHPLWLVERWLERFGPEETERLLERNNQRPAVILRANRLRTDPDDLAARIHAEGIGCERSTVSSENVVLTGGGDVAELAAIREGLCTVQDPSSTLIGTIPPAGRDLTVLDLCAAPGGKCTHFAERTADEGVVVAVDVNPARLNLVRQNARRLGLSSIHCVVADGRLFHARPFELVLVDAPCTGTGVLARRADLRWRLREDEPVLLQDLQLSLLENSSALVKKGGTLLYSTCSIEPEENSGVVRRFLAGRPGFARARIETVDRRFIDDAGDFQTLPHRDSMDGTFASLLSKR